MLAWDGLILISNMAIWTTYMFSVLIMTNYESIQKNNREVLSPAIPYVHSARTLVGIQ